MYNRGSQDSTLMLLLLFVGIGAYGSSKSKGSAANGGGGSGSTSKPAAKPAANAKPAAAPRAADSPEETARLRAAVDAGISQALKDGTLQLDVAHKDTAEQQKALQTDGHAVPVADPHPGDHGTIAPNPPPGADVPAASKTLAPPNTSTLPGGRSPEAAALQLKVFLMATHRFGSAADRPSEVRDAQTDMGIASDGIVGPQTRARAAALGVELPRSPHDAAAALSTIMRRGKAYTVIHTADVKQAQADLGVTPDGIVGPQTRAAAQRAGVTLPAAKK